MRRRRHLRHLVTATAAMTFGTMGLLAASSPAPAGAQNSSQTLTWLAAGDSYASGQGLPHPAGPCAQGTGKNGSGSAWAISAAYLLKSEGITIAGGGPTLVACTGAISDQFFHTDGAKQGAPQWKPAMKRYDLVTFSFGGDDIQFKSTITQCTLAVHLCAPANTERNKITELGSTGVNVLGIHEPGLPTFFNNVANQAVVKGGNVVVMGYPDVFEDPSKWGAVRDLTHPTCSDFLPNIVDRMRGWAGDLNATIGESVLKVDAEPATKRNGVTFTFVNPTTGGGKISASDPDLFEPSSGTRHELCSTGDQPWVNGFSVHRAHSYHPNQAGENAMGALAAEVLQPILATAGYEQAPWAGPAVAAPPGLARAAQWQQSGTPNPWNGCSLYLPTQAGISQSILPLSYGGSSGVADYFVSFEDGMSESVWPPNSAQDYAPDFPNPSRLTYADGSVEETATTGGVTNILVTIPKQPCSFEFSSGTMNSAAAVAALVQSVRLISGTLWSGSTTTPTTQPTAQASCPSSATLMSAFQANPGIYGSSGAPGVQITDFNDIQCWQGWVVAVADSPNSNPGEFVFSQSGGLHAVSESELDAFSAQVCADPTATPEDWTGAAGPANCVSGGSGNTGTTSTGSSGNTGTTGTGSSGNTGNS